MNSGYLFLFKYVNLRVLRINYPGKWTHHTKDSRKKKKICSHVLSFSIEKKNWTKTKSLKQRDEGTKFSTRIILVERDFWTYIFFLKISDCGPVITFIVDSHDIIRAHEVNSRSILSNQTNEQQKQGISTFRTLNWEGGFHSQISHHLGII